MDAIVRVTQIRRVPAPLSRRVDIFLDVQVAGATVCHWTPDVAGSPPGFGAHVTLGGSISLSAPGFLSGNNENTTCLEIACKGCNKIICAEALCLETGCAAAPGAGGRGQPSLGGASSSLGGTVITVPAVVIVAAGHTCMRMHTHALTHAHAHAHTHSCTHTRTMSRQPRGQQDPVRTELRELGCVSCLPRVLPEESREIKNKK